MACANARASGGADPLTTRGGTRLCMLDDDIIHHILERLSDGALVVALTCTHLRDAVHQHSGTHRIESNASHVCVCSPAQDPPQRGLCVRHKHRVRHASPWLCLRPPSPRRRSHLRGVWFGRLTWAVPPHLYAKQPRHRVKWRSWRTRTSLVGRGVMRAHVPPGTVTSTPWSTRTFTAVPGRRRRVDMRPPTGR
jgi:hypothetical protein